MCWKHAAWTISLSLKLNWEPQQMPVIEVEHLRKSYGDTIAVSDVSFTVGEGEIFGILGPNGAGKTTTVESVIGLREPDAGKISVLGLDPRRDRDKLRNLVGVQLQESLLPEKLKVREALELYASFYPSPANSAELLESLGLADKRETPFAKLSGGQKQRLSIALALIGRPRIAVLDELTTGLDPQARRDTWELIGDLRQHGVTVVLVTHFMEEAERLADRVALIDAGRVVATDTPVALAEAVDGEQRIRFRPSVQFGEELLIGLPEVRALERRGDQVLVTGSGDVLGAVVSVLAREGIVAQQLRVEQANLEDAFVALTGNGSNNQELER
jgi:ABC-2 type transport system ATP-binding protein